MARLGEVCDILNGFAFKSEQYVDRGIRIIRIANVQKGFIEDSTPVFYPFDSKDAKKYSLEEGDMLMSLTGNVGRVAKLSKEFLPAALNQRVACLRIKDGVALDKAFLFNLLNSDYFEQQCIAASKGVAQKNMSTEWLKEYEIPMFPIEQQKAIASLLDKVSELIALRKEQLAKLDQLVKSRFIELFGDQETNPFGWTQCTVGECCTLKSGTSLSAEVENEGGPIPYVKVGDMNYPGNERYITTSSRYVSEATAGKGIFEVGSILFPKRGGAIGTNKKRMTKLPICADLNVMGVSSNGQLLPEYLLAYFDMIDLGALSDGSSVPQINNKNIAPLVICVPPMELQKQFAAFVEETDKSKLAIQQSLDKLELLKKSLMQEYFG